MELPWILGNCIELLNWWKRFQEERELNSGPKLKVGLPRKKEVHRRCDSSTKLEVDEFIYIDGTHINPLLIASVSSKHVWFLTKKKNTNSRTYSTVSHHGVTAKH